MDDLYQKLPVSAPVLDDVKPDPDAVETAHIIQRILSAQSAGKTNLVMIESKHLSTTITRKLQAINYRVTEVKTCQHDCSTAYGCVCPDWDYYKTTITWNIAK
jgi:hypothetical protein